MSVETVRKYLAFWGKDSAVREFADSCATVDLAAKAVGVESARIAKTLAFRTDTGCILVSASGDVKIHNAKFKSVFGRRPMMLSPAETLQQTGHAVGGVCPFALPDVCVKTFLDISLQRFTSVFPACGSANSSIELTPDEFFICAKAISWVDVCSVQK